MQHTASFTMTNTVSLQANNRWKSIKYVSYEGEDGMYEHICLHTIFMCRVKCCKKHKLSNSEDKLKVNTFSENPSAIAAVLYNRAVAKVKALQYERIFKCEAKSKTNMVLKFEDRKRVR